MALQSPPLRRLVARALEEKRVELGLTVAQAAEMAGMGTQWTWYDRASGRHPFTLDEIEAFAAAIDAPRGWPLVDWVSATWLETQLARKS